MHHAPFIIPHLEGSVSTSEATVIARALYDSLIGGALTALRAAAATLEGANGTQPVLDRIEALPASTPREVKNLLLALARDGKLDQLPGVVRAFEHYAQRGEAPLTGEVTSAVPLDEAQQARITEELRERYGAGLEVRFTVDPSLIGGLIIRIGDQVLDNSLRTRLSAIQRNMLAS
jgi:F-type H+-transporting ATPase subunit delta